MAHIESQEKAKNIILSIERKFPVNEWKIGDIDIWPHIRIKLYFYLINSSNKKEPLYVNKARPRKKVISTILNSFVSLVSLVIFFLKLRKRKLIFFGAHFHRVLQNGKYFNRFYDSIIEHHDLKDEVYVLEYKKVYNNNYHQASVVNLTIQLNNFKRISKYIKGRVSIKSPTVLEGFKSFDKFLKDNNINPKSLGINELQLIQWARKINKLNLFFKLMYKRVKPEKIVFLGYYGYDDLYSALLTGNHMGITTVDFQHGPQTNIHMAYSSWQKVPKNGFNTMPKEFWNWDKKSKENIDKWAENNTKISSKVIGLPNISYFRKKIKPNKNPNKYLLFSLQTYPLELLTLEVIKLIRDTKYDWVLRLHPRDTTNHSEIIEILKIHGIENKAELQKSTEVPLPEMLSQTKLHITNYSGCTIESKMMGVPTLLIHNLGKEMFSEYIDDKLVYYLDQKEEKFVERAKTIIDQLEYQKQESKYEEIFHPLD